jgi:predicted ATPase/DNA-binding CsgD family transcriptional regulator
MLETGPELHQLRSRVMERSSLSLAELAGSLPRPLSGFVGRAAEIATVSTLLMAPDVRLLTIAGPGGIGKTRLALEVASTLRDAFPDGVIFVSLASTNDPERVPVVIAQALALDPRGDQTAADAVRAVLADRHVLLVLDNLEHLLPAGMFLAGLLGACHGLTILATSRTRLDLSGEHVYTLGPLAVGDARTLFRRRAQAQRGERADAGQDAEITIDAICTRLDRMPLAIELAAARTATLAPQALLSYLDRPLAMLRNGPRDAPLRHQTMRDTIAWSYALLDEEQKAGFRRLAVFVGGFTLKGAQAVLGDDQDAFELVDFLVARSLVVPMAGDLSRPRFTMLESIRQFGVDELAASGEDDAIRMIHADWLIDFAEMAIPFYDGPRMYEFYSAVLDEMYNIRSAMRWSVGRQDGIRANRLAGAVWRLWHSGEASWLTTATWNDRMEEGLVWIERALALREGVPTRYLLESWLGEFQLSANLGRVAFLVPMAEHLLQRGLEANDSLIEHFAHIALSDVALLRDDRDEARAQLYLAAEAGSRSRDPENQLCGVYSGLAFLELGSGNPQEAEAHGRMALDYGLRCGNPHNLVFAIAFFSLALQQQGKWLEAVQAAIEHLRCLAMMRDVVRTKAPVMVVAEAALVANLRSDAVHLLAYAETVPRYDAYDVAAAVEAMARVRATLPEADIAREWEVGTRMTPDDVRQIAERVAAALERNPEPAASDVAGAGLSPREHEVLRLVVAGKTNRAIGEELFISERTVERHVFHIMAKLHLDSRTGLVAWAVRHGVEP